MSADGVLTIKGEHIADFGGAAVVADQQKGAGQEPIAEGGQKKPEEASAAAGAAAVDKPRRRQHSSFTRRWVGGCPMCKRNLDFGTVLSEENYRIG